MIIVHRAEWAARAPTARTAMTTPTPRLWVHHTAGNERGPIGMRAIQNFHMNVRGYVDIAYSFVVDNADGVIYEGRGAGVVGGHTQGDNDRSHAICVMGNFETAKPTPQALASIVALAQHGRDRGWWVPTLGGHRDAPGASTACPGRNLYVELPELRRRVAGTTPQEDDFMALFNNVTDFKTAVRDAVQAELETIGDPSRQALYDLFRRAVHDELGDESGTALGVVIARVESEIKSSGGRLHTALDSWADSRTGADGPSE